MLYPSVTSSHHITPQRPLGKEKNKADRERAVLSLTYALAILSKKHLHLLKPLDTIPCVREAAKHSSVADAGICERKGWAKVGWWGLHEASNRGTRREFGARVSLCMEGWLEKKPHRSLPCCFLCFVPCFWTMDTIISFPLNYYPHISFTSEVKTAFSNLLRTSYSKSLQVFKWKLLRIRTDLYWF